MKHLLIILISLLLLGCVKNQGTEFLYLYESSSGVVLKSVGEFKDDLRNGQGTMTLPDGGKYVGEYKNGEVWNGMIYDKNGKIIVKFVNGKVK
jgi:hypothetical protein